MFTENKDFYPTPAHLITKMMEGIDLRMVHSILEPSAGKGNIVDYIRSQRYGDKLDIDCIEKDQNLRAVLKEKHRVVHDDFLTYGTMKQYSLIIMNPPFSDGASHLLKAMDMQEESGGGLVCLLNADTIRNAYTMERKTLVRRLNDCGADIKFLDDQFLDAERKTRVSVALIRIKYQEKTHRSFIWSDLVKAQEEKDVEESYDNQLAENDFIKSIIAQYEMEVEAGVKLIEEVRAMSPRILTNFQKKDDKYERTGAMIFLSLASGEKATVNNYIRSVRAKYWGALFTNPKFTGKLTSKLVKEYMQRVSELQDYDFSAYNIGQIKADMDSQVIKGIEDEIISLFDELSHKYSWIDEMSQNIHLYNGWKTNKAHMINKKVILPINAWEDLCGDKYYRPTRTYSYWNVMGKLADIEKCLSYLDGGLTDGVNLEERIREVEKSGQTKNIELRYFTITFYKKGTCHLTFKNDDLLKKFNIYGCQKKGWLPPWYGKKKYADMSDQEKRDVSEFDSYDYDKKKDTRNPEAEYKKVEKNSAYFIVNPSQFLLTGK